MFLFLILLCLFSTFTLNLARQMILYCSSYDLCEFSVKCGIGLAGNNK
jgi:hypothetical protein